MAGDGIHAGCLQFQKKTERARVSVKTVSLFLRLYASFVKEGYMNRFAKQSIVFLLIGAFLMVPLGSTALAQEYFESGEPTGGQMVFDLAFMRPAGILATAFGSVVWVLALPFSALADNVDESTEMLVKDPAEFTFKRPLGHF